jgi:Holliday junction resolvasome RuvABC DNA-binding subunit
MSITEMLRELEARSTGEAEAESIAAELRDALAQWKGAEAELSEAIRHQVTALESLGNAQQEAEAFLRRES